MDAAVGGGGGAIGLSLATGNNLLFSPGELNFTGCCCCCSAGELELLELVVVVAASGGWELLIFSGLSFLRVADAAAAAVLELVVSIESVSSLPWSLPFVLLSSSCTSSMMLTVAFFSPSRLASTLSLLLNSVMKGCYVDTRRQARD